MRLLLNIGTWLLIPTIHRPVLAKTPTTQLKLAIGGEQVANLSYPDQLKEQPHCGEKTISLSFPKLPEASYLQKNLILQSLAQEYYYEATCGTNDCAITIDPKKRYIVPETYTMRLLLVSKDSYGVEDGPADVLDWSIGSIKIEHNLQRLPTTLNPEQLEDNFAVLPEIKADWQESKQDSMFTNSVAPLFSVIVFAPWILLAKQWSKLGISLLNFGPLSKDGKALTMMLGCLALWTALAVCNWVFLNIFHTIYTALILGVVTFFVGLHSLRKTASPYRNIAKLD